MVTAALVIIVAVTTVAAVFLTHPRDETAYIAYVHTYGNGDGKPLDDPPSDQALLDAGESACDWLTDQRPALWRNDTERTIPALMERYDSKLHLGEGDLPTTVTPGAWAHLCPAALAFVRPHRPFDRSD